MNTKLLLVGLLATVGLAGSGAVTAQDWGGFPYAPACWGYGYPASYVTESVPYFALHPPVYYSFRVARTYGYSPFAYPPGVLTPGSEPPRPATYQAASGEMPESRQTQPLRIDNPFVEQANGPGVTQRRNPSGRKPQVVYPAALARRTESAENRSGHGR